MDLERIEASFECNTSQTNKTTTAKMNWFGLRLFIESFRDKKDVWAYAENNKDIESDLILLMCNNKVICPHCESITHYKTNRGFKCSDCLKKFGVRQIMGIKWSKVPFSKFIKISWMVYKGESSLCTAKSVGLTQKTTYNLMNLINSMWDNGASIIKNEKIKEINKAKILTRVLAQKIKEGCQTN